MNKTFFIGRIANELEIRKTPNGTAVLKFSLAVDSGRDTTYFFDIVAFNKQAEFIANYFNKGRKIAICAKATHDTWTDQEGKKRSKVMFIVDDAEFADSKPKQDDFVKAAPDAELPFK